MVENDSFSTITMQSKKILMVVLGISLCVNVIGFYFIYTHVPIFRSVLGIQTADTKYSLLSKRILQEFPQDVLINFLSLRQQLQEQTAPYGDSFGLYFEYLPTGTSIGINANREFYAASLIKVPMVMAYYHMRERTHMQDDPVVEIKKEHIDKKYGNLWKKGEGYKLKASEAVKLALIESDNTAVRALSPLITEADFAEVYDALDIDFQSDPSGAIISARNYASVLKALYFSSILNKDNSQEILTLLTETKFSDKLASGVPHDIAVAHKGGDFAGNGTIGFRDCGIVYVPRRPYLVCMFSESDEPTARERMQTVSMTIYNYLTTHSLFPPQATPLLQQ